MNDRRSRSMLPLLMSAITGPAMAQQVWKVDCQNFPGTDFTDLPPAVAAAAPGDTVLVIYRGLGCPGMPNGAGYTATTIDKPLAIVGVYVGGGGVGVGLSGQLTIASIAAGQRVILSNIGMAHVPFAGSVGELVIRDCAGAVILEDCPYVNYGLPGQVLRIERCDDVTLRGCDWTIGGAPVYVVDSTVLVTNTGIRHFPPYSWCVPACGYTQNAPGMALTNSTVTIVGSLVEGMGRLGSMPGQAAQTGVLLQDSTLRIGAGAVVLGGLLGGGGRSRGYHDPSPVTSIVELDPRAVVDDLTPFVTPLPIPTDVHAVYHSWVIAGEPYGVTVVGPPNGFALLALSQYATAPIPTPFGTTALDPIGLQAVDVVALPSSNGAYQWTFDCPVNAPVATAFVFQALTLSPTGAFGVTIPSPLAIAWPGGVIP